MKYRPCSSTGPYGTPRRKILSSSPATATRTRALCADGSLAAAARPGYFSEIRQRRGGLGRRDCAPGVGPEGDHEVHAAGRDVRRAEATEGGHGLVAREAKPEVELQEVMRRSAPREDAELRQGEGHGWNTPWRLRSAATSTATLSRRSRSIERPAPRYVGDQPTCPKSAQHRSRS